MIVSSSVKRLGFCGAFFSTGKPNLQHYTAFPIQAYDVGKRVDRYLKSTPIGWASAQKHLRSKDIVVMNQAGEVIDRNQHRLQDGDQLLIRKGKDIESLLLGEKNPKHMQLDFERTKQVLEAMTVFNSERIAVLNKPAGFSVQGGDDPNYNVFSLMATRFKKDMIYISHRLDKPTTGLVLVPKDLQTAQLLGEALKSRNGVEKYYLALTEGRKIVDKTGSMACQIEWTSKHKARMIESLTQEGDSQLAITQYLRVKHRKINDHLERNLIGMKLVTGRKHQIRCQLSQYLINPVLNDLLYHGRKVPQAKDAIFLHSFGLKISDRQLLEQVFKIPLSSQPSTVHQSQQGSVSSSPEGLTIISHLPQIWQPYQAAINNDHLPHILATIQRECKTQPPFLASSQIE